ncbi:unnamed protein product [Rotaria socialis]|uniref:Uncharacterized protein n=1 Tax=Rotaria socialis TaxID=392032 RepID=A0A817ZKY2_9BILA|nr:unnamed protein product [Rotaria socialis]CAF3506156.1 unnamed protein product [Rotaria socialis]CAF3517077.1 unnamed protein product [Rotaria socialis]CAF3725433.1 unnamed protein product [Rotaria socialis]CAF4401426.1 unnamed protein product [Rotaria socialis]
MTFKGMLKIVVNDFKKQHEEKMFSIANELMKTRRELKDVKEQLRALQLNQSTSSPDIASLAGPTISLFVQYYEFFNELCDFQQTMTVNQLLIKLRQITGIPQSHPIRIRVLSKDGSTTLFYLDKKFDRTLESYEDDLKPRMILKIENDEESGLEKKTNRFQRAKSLSDPGRTHSYESDV